LIDCCGIGFLNNVYIPTEEVFSEKKAIMSVIAGDQDIFRLYSPSYSIPQYIAAKEGLELSDGVDPLQITTYRDFMDRAAGIESQGYSVTIPPFETGNPEIDNLKAQPDATLMGLLNIKYMVSAYEVEGEGFELMGEYPNGFLYRNKYYLPRAWIQPHNISIENPPKNHELIEVPLANKEANRINLVATGPGRLILSEIEYPGWVAQVNGKAVSISPAYKVLRSIDLPPGENEIDFRYRPLSIYGGMVLGIVGWGYCLYKLKEQDVKRLYS
jgi:hypothetical protein